MIVTRAALAEYRAAEQLQAELEGSYALSGQLAGWRLSTQARLGQLAAQPSAAEPELSRLRVRR